MDKDYLKMRWGDWIVDDGFLALPNTLIEHFEDLDITNSELIFLQKILKHKNGYIIHDEKLWKGKTSRTLNEYRRSLKKKGLLNYHIEKKYIDDSGYVTAGIKYDTSKLVNKLKEFFCNRDTKNLLEEGEKSPLSGRKTSTLHNTNYNNIYYTGGEQAHSRKNNKAKYMGAESSENNLYTQFIKEYKRINIERYGLDFSFPLSFNKLLDSVDSSHIMTITHYLDYWFDWVDDFNSKSSKKIDGSPYLLFKGGKLINKFLSWAKNKEKLNKTDFTVFKEDRNIVLPPENETVKLFIKKSYQILSHKNILHKQAEKYKEKAFSVEDDYFKVQKWLLKNKGDLIKDGFDFDRIIKDFSGSPEPPDLTSYLDNLKSNLHRIKTQGVRKADVNNLFNIAIAMKGFFTDGEYNKLFNSSKEDVRFRFDNQFEAVNKVLSEFDTSKAYKSQGDDEDLEISWEYYLKESGSE